MNICFKNNYSSLDESFKTFSSPNFKETKIPTKRESAINPKEAHSGTWKKSCNNIFNPTNAKIATKLYSK